MHDDDATLLTQFVEDRRETAALGANRYFRKPTSYQEFLKIAEVLEEVLAEHRPQ